MIEGGCSDDFRRSKALLYEHPAALRQLLNVLTESVAVYLAAQAKAGAQVLMIFDTWGGVLAQGDFGRVSLAPISRVIEQLKKDPAAAEVPIILYTKGGSPWIVDIAATGCAAVGCDWGTFVSLGAVRQLVRDQVALQGNLDPAVLFASSEQIREQVAAVLTDFGEGPGHMFNLGHGIPPGVSPDRVATLVDAVHQLSCAGKWFES